MRVLSIHSHVSVTVTLTNVIFFGYFPNLLFCFGATEPSEPGLPHSRGL